MWKWMGLFLKKNHLRFWGWLSLLNCIGALTLSLLLKQLPKKMEPWFVLWSFYLLTLLCIYINKLYGHAWSTVVMSELVPPSCYLELVNKLRKQKFRTACPSLTVSLETLGLCRNIASLSLFYRYYFGRCSSELAQLVPLPYSEERPSCCSFLINCMSFLSLFLDVTRISMPTVSSFA